MSQFTIRLRPLVILALLATAPLASLAAETKPAGESADVSYQEAVYIGVGGSYALERDAFGEPSARGTILLKSRETGEWEAHETSLKFEYGLALELEGWRGKYKGMVFKTNFVDSRLPAYVFLATEGSNIKSRQHFYATALWDTAQEKWLPNESAIRAKRRK
jgi:hypothetical protein